MTFFGDPGITALLVAPPPDDWPEADLRSKLELDGDGVNVLCLIPLTEAQERLAHIDLGPHHAVPSFEVFAILANLAPIYQGPAKPENGPESGPVGKLDKQIRVKASGELTSGKPKPPTATPATKPQTSTPAEERAAPAMAGSRWRNRQTWVYKERMQWGAAIRVEKPIDWGFESKLRTTDPTEIMGRMEEELMTLAEELGVPPLRDFGSSTRADWWSWGYEEDEIPASVSDEPQWHSAEDGLRTVRALLSAIEKRQRISGSSRTKEELKADGKEAADMLRVWEQELLGGSDAELLTNVGELVAAVEADENSTDAAYDPADVAAVLEILHLWERELARASEIGVRFVYDGFEL